MARILLVLPFKRMIRTLEIGMQLKKKAYSYPSDEFTQAHGEDNEKINKFAEAMKGFSPGDFIPVNAKVSYKKNQMDTLNMDIVIKYNGKTELMALTQLAAQSMLDQLPKDAKSTIADKVRE